MRRWNDLKLMMEELQREHSDKLSSACIPKFEAHAWRFGAAALESSFLDERALNMQNLLQALVTELGWPSAPKPLQDLLRADGEPGSQPTPARQVAREGDSPRQDKLAPITPLLHEAAPAVVPSAKHDHVELAKKAGATAAPSAAAPNGTPAMPEDEQQLRGLPSDGADDPNDSVLPPSWFTIVLWSSVIMLPIVAVVAKEVLGTIW
eukprot:CAMPEP_0119319632 /NCGR_PEP_ID=MMETSP1333-20130426/49928_1 /TAXON_ID=418940 /ORGANISM="Scyphosphaera apsteinii, Strain RCC1455" /LENGTH=206 /DNA_ID=CAMNT_0007326095 /DNA_START=180 /DNA_END=797 /DNA_ORIENTATION=+